MATSNAGRGRGRRIALALRAAILAGLLLPALHAIAHAQAGQPIDCSGTVGTSAAAISFKTTNLPHKWVFIVNPSATAALWLNINGGTAAANASGSFPLIGTGNSVTLSDPAVLTISIIASADATPYTCSYQ